MTKEQFEMHFRKFFETYMQRHQKMMRQGNDVRAGHASKRSMEQIVHHGIIRKRISEAYQDDIKIIEKCSIEPFMDIDDVVNRLVPFHLHDVQETKSEETLEEIIQSAENIMTEFDVIIENDKQVFSGFF